MCTINALAARLWLPLLLLVGIASGCKNAARFPIAGPDKALLNDRITGRWKFHEDTNTHNLYEILSRRQPYPLDRYHVLFWDQGGAHASYEGNMYFSKIDSVLFVNVPCRNAARSEPGFVFLRILDINDACDEITIAVVGDTTLWQLSSQAEVRGRIASNMNNPSFYSDTLNFYKMGTGSDAVPTMNFKK